MPLDAIIISNFGTESLSASNTQRLILSGRVADIQTIINYLQHNGKIEDPIVGSDKENWSSAPTLNGLMLSVFLNKRGYSTELINDFYHDNEHFIRAIKRNPKLIAISTSFVYTKDHLIKIVKNIRQQAPDALIVAGGPFVYKSYLIHKRSCEPIYSSKEIKQSYLFFENNQPAIDIYVVSQHGENTLWELLAALRNNKSLKTIPNTARYENDTAFFTERVEESSQIEDCFVNWNEIDKSFFSSKVVPIQASIGCSYRCAFCNFTGNRRHVLSKPFDQVLLEFKTIAQYGIQYVWFVDDNFMPGSSNLNAFLKKLAEVNPGIKWMSFIRADALKNIDFKLLRRSGCIEVQLGLESADPQILQNMNKKANPETYRMVIENLLKVGINCSCYFIFGFPGETAETAERTRNFIKSIDYPKYEGVMRWSFYPFMLVPLSPIFEEDQRQRYRLKGSLSNWTHATMNNEQAMQEILKTILECESSSEIYRSDNLSLLNTMTKDQKNLFYSARHRLSKKALFEKLQSSEIMQTFRKAITNDMLKKNPNSNGLWDS
jgi:anaerobic magnesium-protoporphyrin IX monomethyl ester cyclase